MRLLTSSLIHSVRRNGRRYIERNAIMSYIGSVDQGTSSSRFLLFSGDTGESVACHQVATHSSHPKEGWCEQDPKEILSSVLQCIESVGEQCRTKNIDLSLVKGVGITNQRESTVVWDKLTGEPLHPAIIWLDGRTADIVERLIQKTPSNSKHEFQKICGLPLSTYFSAVKLRWLIENSQDVRNAIEKGTCCFGTIDTWLVWNLTGGVNGGAYVTDVTNASRTMLMNLSTLQWDKSMCDFFDVSMNMLPQIRSSSEIFGEIKQSCLTGVPISGILGDQQAALVGQHCFTQGEAKNTYGTGNFLLYNTGEKTIFSKHGLLTTVGYKFGPDANACYALEGSIAITGEAIKWLRDKMGIIKSAAEIEGLASSVKDNGDVYFVPAFSGLLAPHWQTDARGLLIGLTQASTKCHIARAALEACCFQTKDVLNAMDIDSGIPLKQLQVDGGMTVNNFLMQLQADILGINVVRAKVRESTALGAAIAAGKAKGVECWNAPSFKDGTENCEVFKPSISLEEQERLYGKWKEAVKRSFSWKS